CRGNPISRTDGNGLADYVGNNGFHASDGIADGNLYAVYDYAINAYQHDGDIINLKNSCVLLPNKQVRMEIANNHFSRLQGHEATSIFSENDFYTGEVNIMETNSGTQSLFSAIEKAGEDITQMIGVAHDHPIGSNSNPTKPKNTPTGSSLGDWSLFRYFRKNYNTAIKYGIVIFGEAKNQTFTIFSPGSTNDENLIKLNYDQFTGYGE
ncbi:MAG: hypothetical protein ACOCVN_02840, partial [bacterium]